MKFLLKLLPLLVVFVGATAHADRYTSSSAPDPVSRAVLSKRVLKLQEGAVSGSDPSMAIHRNFTQIIEQNFAELSPAEASARLDALSEAELSDLAQLYINAASDNGQPARLFNVLAARLDSTRLARVSRHFGFVATYSGITASAPSKIEAFLAQAATSSVGPTPGEQRFGPYGRFAPSSRHSATESLFYQPASMQPAIYIGGRTKTAGRMIKTAGFGQFLNYTPYEVYLSFRTAPVGALGVTGALYETTVVLSSTLLEAYGTGYAIGTFVINPLINTYAPSLGDAIGGTVAGIVDWLSSSWSGGTATAGPAQQSAATSFQSTPAQIQNFSTLGGDFGVTSDFSDYVGGGGSCRSGRCPPVELH